MPRVKRAVASKKRHNKVFSKTRGFRHGRKNLIKLAKQAAVRAETNAYIGRKQKKRTFKSLWIIRINAVCRKYDTTYSQFISSMRKKNLDINRKELSQMALENEKSLQSLIEKSVK